MGLRVEGRGFRFKGFELNAWIKGYIVEEVEFRFEGLRVQASGYWGSGVSETSSRTYFFNSSAELFGV